jgi:hypothetical protein
MLKLLRRAAVAAPALFLCSCAPLADESPPAGQGKKDGLSLTASLEKKVFRPGEDITLSFKLKNESDKAMYVGDGHLAPDYHEVGNQWHFELHLTDENNAQLRFGSDTLTEGETAGVRKVFLLKPGEAYEGSIYLVASGRKEVKINGYARKTRSGMVKDVKTNGMHELGKDGRKYTLTLLYRCSPSPVFGATPGSVPPEGYKDELLWKGEIKSSPLELEITEK